MFIYKLKPERKKKTKAKAGDIMRLNVQTIYHSLSMI